MSDKEFVSGLYGKVKSDKSPDFLICKLSVKREDLITWLQGKSDEWINLDVTKRQSDPSKLNISVDNWKPNNTKSSELTEEEMKLIKLNRENQNKSIKKSDDEIIAEDIPF